MAEADGAEASEVAELATPGAFKPVASSEFDDDEEAGVAADGASGFGRATETGAEVGVGAGGSTIGARVPASGWSGRENGGGSESEAAVEAASEPEANARLLGGRSGANNAGSMLRCDCEEAELAAEVAAAATTEAPLVCDRVGPRRLRASGAARIPDVSESR